MSALFQYYNIFRLDIAKANIDTDQSTFEIIIVFKLLMMNTENIQHIFILKQCSKACTVTEWGFLL